MNFYVVLTVLAGVLWGSISLFLTNLVSAGLNTLQIMFVRAFMSSIMMAVLFLVKDRKLFKIQIKDLWMFLGSGVLSLTFFSLCYFKTIQENGASIGVVLLYTSPIFVLLMSLVLFKEKLNLMKIIALIMTFSGCVFVTELVGGNNSISLKGFIIGIASGFEYALYSIFSRFALKKYKPLTVTFYTFVFSGLSLIPFCNINSIFHTLGNPKILFFITGISLFCTVLPYIFYTTGLSGLETGKAAILVIVEPVVGSLVGILILGESVSVQKIAGIILILISVVMLGLEPGKKQK